MKRRNCKCFRLLLRSLLLLYCFFYSYPMGVVEIDAFLLGTLATSTMGSILVYFICHARIRSLESSNRELISWVGNTAHDLMAPIGAIQGYAEILDLSLESSDQAADHPPFAKNILDLSARLEGMARDLTNISAVRTKTKRFKMEIVSLNDMTQRVLKLYDFPQSNTSTFHFHPATSEGLIFCHPSLVERAIQNLLQNANRYSPEGSQIGIHIFQENQHIFLQVVNTGRSTAPQQWNRLFQRYQQGGENLGKGSGLGLSIVKEVMSIHQGEVNVSKRDKQITFTLCFPVPASTSFRRAL